MNDIPDKVITKEFLIKKLVLPRAYRNHRNHRTLNARHTHTIHTASPLAVFLNKVDPAVGIFPHPGYLLPASNKQRVRE